MRNIYRQVMMLANDDETVWHDGRPWCLISNGEVYGPRIKQINDIFKADAWYRSIDA